MARLTLSIHSDFHVESPRHGPSLAFSPAPSDVVVVAGDISPPCFDLLRRRRHGALAWLRKSVGADRTVVFVMGNNEYSHFVYDQVLDALQQEAAENDIHFLHNSTSTIGGVEFLGTPLFTSQRLPGLDDEVLASAITKKVATFDRARLVHDFCICGKTPICAAHSWKTGVRDAHERVLGSDWFALEHEKSVEFLRSTLSRPAASPRVVVTHWAPSLSSIPESEYPLSPKHAFWASDCDDLVRMSNVWIHGHVHRAPSYRIGRDPAFGNVVSNCLGTPFALYSNDGYTPDGVLGLEWDAERRGEGLSLSWVIRP